MSARANPYHPAYGTWTESFFGTLKAEMQRNGCFASQKDAAHELFAFIDGYYNTPPPALFSLRQVTFPLRVSNRSR